MERLIFFIPDITAVVSQRVCARMRYECIYMSTGGNLEARCPFIRGQLFMATMYKPCLISQPTVVQSVFYSGHTIWQKNIFICFPGESYNGLYLFNKVNPYELQRLLGDEEGESCAATADFQQQRSVISSSEWEGCTRYF